MYISIKKKLNKHRLITHIINQVCNKKLPRGCFGSKGHVLVAVALVEVAVALVEVAVSGVRL